jgi:hypothetical protein
MILLIQASRVDVAKLAKAEAKIKVELDITCCMHSKR